MPKYHYKCDSCSREWWEWLSVSQSDRKDCPYCEGPPPQKIPSGFTVISDPVENKKTSKQNVVDHIEDNKKILKKMRDKAVNEDILKND